MLRGELRVVIDLVFPCPEELHNRPDVFWHREWCGEVMRACVCGSQTVVMTGYVGQKS